MKFLLLLLCCFGISTVSTSTLRDDLNELISTLQLDDLRTLVEKYSQKDDRFIEMIKDIQGKSEDTEFLEFIIRVLNNAQLKSFAEWLNTAHNIDLDSELSNILDDINGITIGSGGNLGGVEKFFEEFLEMYDIEKTRLKIIELLRRSDDFVDFFLTISSDGSKRFFEEFLFVDEQFKVLIQELADAGVDVELIRILFYAILGWEY